MPYVADFCNDGILTSEPGPGIDTWTNLCHTAQGDKYPTMTFTYPCQQGLSKAVVYNFRCVPHAAVLDKSPYRCPVDRLAQMYV